MIDVRVLDIKPHPDQDTNNPGSWAVRFRVSHKGDVRTFWRWHSVRKLNKNDVLIRPDNVRPSSTEILASFWEDLFRGLHGFDFERLEDGQ